jgi:hypothetical protein
MWQDSPDSRLEMIRQDQAQRRLEARRLDTRPNQSHRHGLSGRHFHLGPIIVFIGRALTDDGSRSPRPIHS